MALPEFVKPIWYMRRSLFIYGLAGATLLIALRWVDYSLFVGILSFEVYVGLLASLFTVIGIVIGLRLTGRKSEEVDTARPFELNPSRLKVFGISQREYEVLELMALGHSNKEIAEALYISLNTVKTHVSNVYVKLDVKRRTQAIQKAKSEGLLP